MSLLAGRYRLQEEIGHGAMGTVWRGVDELLDREVAIKQLRGPAERLKRSLREARITAQLNHPNIASLYDVVAGDDGFWIVLELVKARSLAEVSPLDPVRAAEIGLDVLAALQAAHAAGIVHRDVKPDNILIAADGHAVLTDFGIASADDGEALTETGMVVGTPAYIAPERVVGTADGPESDLWSLGATLYTAVEGHTPFERNTKLSTLAAVISGRPHPFANAGPLTPVIAGLLRKDPTRRLTAERAETMMRRVIAAEPVAERSVTLIRGAAAAVAVLVVVILASFARFGPSGQAAADTHSWAQRSSRLAEALQITQTALNPAGSTTAASSASSGKSSTGKTTAKEKPPVKEKPPTKDKKPKKDKKEEKK